MAVLAEAKVLDILESARSRPSEPIFMTCSNFRLPADTTVAVTSSRPMPSMERRCRAFADMNRNPNSARFANYQATERWLASSLTFVLSEEVIIHKISGSIRTGCDPNVRSQCKVSFRDIFRKSGHLFSVENAINEKSSSAFPIQLSWNAL